MTSDLFQTQLPNNFNTYYIPRIDLSEEVKFQRISLPTTTSLCHTCLKLSLLETFGEIYNLIYKQHEALKEFISWYFGEGALGKKEVKETTSDNLEFFQIDSL